MFIEEQEYQKIQSRLYIIKSMNGITSLKVPLLMIQCILLMCQTQFEADKTMLGTAYQNCGIVGTSLLLTFFTWVNMHMYYKVIHLAKLIREEVGISDLQLDFSEIMYYTMTERLKWNKRLAGIVRSVVDFIVIWRLLLSVMQRMSFAVVELCRICNRYGSTFEGMTAGWFSIIPLYLISLIGNLNALATFAAISNCGIIYAYLTMSIDASSGIFNIGRTKLMPNSVSDAVDACFTCYTAQSLFYNAIIVRNEAKSEENFDKKWGSFPIASYLILFIHITVPSLHFLKYGTNFLAFMEKTEPTIEMIQLVIAVANFISCGLKFYGPFHMLFPKIVQLIHPKGIICLEATLKLVLVVLAMIFYYIVENLPGTVVFAKVSKPLLCIGFPILLETLSEDKMSFCKKFFNQLLLLVTLCLTVFAIVITLR